jgi:hypothetical protein
MGVTLEAIMGVLTSDYRLKKFRLLPKIFIFSPFFLLTFPVHLKTTEFVLWVIL